MLAEAFPNCVTETRNEQGQPLNGGAVYRVDPGPEIDPAAPFRVNLEFTGFKNSDLAIPLTEVLKNIQAIVHSVRCPYLQGCGNKLGILVRIAPILMASTSGSQWLPWLGRNQCRAEIRWRRCPAPPAHR